MILDDVKTVVDNIEDFIELPDGIKQLRKMVLNLAFSGKLVPQDSIEGTADYLYKKIQNESVVKTKKSLQLSLVRDDESPFKLPDSWMWLRLGNIGKIVGGGTPSTSNKHFFTDPSDIDSVPWLAPADMRKQTSMYISHGKQNITQLGLNSSSATLMPEGSVIFSSRAPIGYVGIAVNKLTTNQGFKSIIPFDGIKPEYIYWYLKFRAPDINDRAPGTTFKEISGSAFSKEIISLPPTQEQVRIVEKISQVMEYLDKLERKKTEREKIRASLTHSAMHSLGVGDADIALQNLEDLVKTSSDLKELEKSVLTLAVSGKLVSHDSNEGDTNDFYFRIHRDNLGRKKKNEVIMPEDINKTPFNIPNTWKWVSLGDICGFEYGFTDSAKDEGDARFVRITDIGNDSRLISENHKFIELNDESKKSMLREGDALVARIGATFGRTILFKEKYPAVYASYLIRITFDKNFLLPDYYWIFAQSNAYWDQALSLVSGSAQPQFNANLIKKILLPVPPHAEQIRIVKKVEEMMELMRSLSSILSR